MMLSEAAVVKDESSKEDKGYSVRRKGRLRWQAIQKGRTTLRARVRW